MYRLLLAIVLCRAVFGASTTPPSPGIDNGVGVIANDGGTGQGETEVEKNRHDAEQKQGENFKGHGATEAELLQEEEEYKEWLQDCANGEDPEIDELVNNYLERNDMTVDDLNAECEAMMSSDGNGRKRYIQAGAGLWAKCTVPFLFDDSLSEDGKNAVGQVHAEFAKKTGFRFVPYTNNNAALGLDHNNTLLYLNGSGCWSYVGNIKPSNNRQKISPCGSFDVALHEIGHALGFLHEHNDPAAYPLMKPNFDNVPSDDLSTFKMHNVKGVHLDGNFYDLTSEMHYANWFKKKGYGWKMLVDEPELTYLIGSSDYYYMFKDLQKYHNCYAEFDSCSTLPVCENDGYASVINGACACACPEGLDPATKCTTILGDKTNEWPAGTYSLLKVEGYDCPEGLEFGQMARWNWGWQWDNGKYISGGKKDYYEFVFDVCTRTSSVGSTNWPEGNYCLFKRGDCPDGFSEGLIESWGKVPERENSSFGAVPDGKKGQDFEFRFCCRDDGSRSTGSKLPSKVPFITLAGSYWGCQKVEGMEHLKDYYMAKNSNKTLAANGSLPYHYKFYGKLELYYTYYCAYFPVTKEFEGKPCGEIKHFAAGETTYTFTTPNHPSNYPKGQECLWYFESPEGTTMKIEFDDFEVSTANDANCESYVELKTLRPGMTGYKLCGHHEKKTRLTVYNKLMVNFHSSIKEPQKGFKATVTILSEANQCYPGNGENTYAGTINYSRSMKACLPWSEVTNCALNKFASSSTNLDLPGNACRTPRTGRMPWCYTNKELCIRENCDVCMRDKCFDVLPNCANLVSGDSEFCTKNEVGEAKRGCMKTCGFCDSFTLVAAYSTVTCSAPGDVTSISPTPVKSSYNVGDEVEYKCPSSNVVRKRTCRNDGKWSPLGYVCSGCTAGFTYVRGRCYKWMQGMRESQSNAQTKCEEIGASLVVVESDEQLEGVMGLTTFDKYGNDNVWFNIKYTDDTWKWGDGTNSNYISWSEDADKTKTWYCLAGTLPNTMYTSWCGWSKDVVCGMNPTGTFECEDDEPTCSDVLAKDPDMCETYPDYAWTNCRKTCGVTGCTGTSTCTVQSVTNGQQVKGENSVNQGQILRSTGEKCSEQLGLFILRVFSSDVVPMDWEESIALNLYNGNGEAMGQDSYQGLKYVEFKCNEGFYLKSGNLKRTCLSTGSFNGDAPVCAGPSEVSSVELFTDVEMFRRHYYNDLNYAVAANLDMTRLTANGKITAWTFFASEAGEVTMLVWRPNPTNDKEFTLVGKNTLTVTADNRAVKMRVDAADQISVTKGDVIGLVMPKPVITYSDCDKKNMAAYTPWLTTPEKYKPEELEINKAYTMKEYSKPCRVYSIRVTLDPQ